jgi:excisionase family DNA binding protein
MIEQFPQSPQALKASEPKGWSHPAPRMLYTRREAAKLLSLSVSTVQMLISRNLLGSRKIGSKRLIPHASLVAFSQKNLPSLWLPKHNGKTVNTEKSLQRQLGYSSERGAKEPRPAAARQSS